jgi:ATP-dependent protease ClpP protease subunit
MKGEAVTLRMNCPGGSPEDAYGMIAKWQEHSGPKSIKVDGGAKSMGAYFLCYADKGSRECLDVSSFLIHRAAYPSWIENDKEAFTEDRKKSLNTINSQLRAGLEQAIDVPTFQQMTGYTMDDIYSLDNRIDVSLTAEQALKIGLVDKINSIIPQKRSMVMQAIEAGDIAIAAIYNDAPAPTAQIPTGKPQSTNMTQEQLRAQHPDVYAAIVDEGAKAERIRVNTWLKHVDVDAKVVADGIKSGASLTDDVREELMIKRISGKTLAALEGEAPKAVTTNDTTAASAEPNFDSELQAIVSKII